MDWGDFWASFLRQSWCHTIFPLLCQGSCLQAWIFRECCQTGLSFYVSEKITKWESLPLLFPDIKQLWASLLRPSTNTLKTSWNCWLLLGQKGKQRRPTLPITFLSKVINLYASTMNTTLDGKNLFQVYLNNTWEFGSFPYDVRSVLIMAWPIWLWKFQVRPI